ncbi:MAG: phosphoribosylanthranilate isomerase [Candidatus Omnitrophota bacterium]
MIKVKICGITNLDDALDACGCEADALGFIFTKKSPRYISKQAAKKIIQQLGPFVVKTGVFLDEEKNKVLNIASSLRLDVLQFHGRESSAYCDFFKPKFKIIKVLFERDLPFKKKISLYNPDAFLFDVKYEEKSKGNKTLSLETLKELKGLIKAGKKVIISGGLNIQNIEGIKKLQPYAVDVCSGVEEYAGKKSRKLVDCFIRKVKC